MGVMDLWGRKMPMPRRRWEPMPWDWRVWDSDLRRLAIRRERVWRSWVGVWMVLGRPRRSFFGWMWRDWSWVWMDFSRDCSDWVGVVRMCLASRVWVVDRGLGGRDLVILIW